MKLATVKPGGIRVKMGNKQLTLLLIIFFSLVLVSSSTKILHPDRKQYWVAHVSTTGHSSHGGSAGGSAGGGRGGDGSQGDTGTERNPSGESNMNHHRRGASIRVQCSVFLTWVVAINAIQFCIQLL